MWGAAMAGKLGAPRGQTGGTEEREGGGGEGQGRGRAQGDETDAGGDCFGVSTGAAGTRRLVGALEHQTSAAGAGTR